MNEVKLYNKLKEGYETTTRNYNSFQQVIESIKWEDTYTADNELYYLLGGFSLSVGSLNPFDENCVPFIIFSDGSMRCIT